MPQQFCSILSGECLLRERGRHRERGPTVRLRRTQELPLDPHTRRGGDIDLYIESALSPEEAVRARLSMLAHLYRRIGERRIDLVLNTGRSDEPIFRVAKREGQKL